MKTFVCELCDGTQFAKSNGSFVCMECGTQYSAEDMRNLVRHTPDNEATTKESDFHHAPQTTIESTRETIPEPTAHSSTEYEISDDIEYPVFDRPINNGVVENATEDQPKKTKEKKKKKISLGIIIGSIASGLMFVTFISCLIVACDPNSNSGNVFLLITGLFDLLIASILYKVIIHMERFNCPVCAAKRTHHREFDYTTEKYTENDKFAKTEYTHHYTDTYVCNQCGETRTEKIRKSGGYYTECAEGNDMDHRIAPREF